MQGFQLNALCLVLFGGVALAAETGPTDYNPATMRGWQPDRNQLQPGYPQQETPLPSRQMPRYRPVEPYPAQPRPYADYPSADDRGTYGYPQAYPQQEYYPAYPPADYTGNAYYPATPDYRQNYYQPQPYNYPYVYERAPAYGDYPAAPAYDNYPYPQADDYYDQAPPMTGPDYGQPLNPPAYAYPQEGYREQPPASTAYPPGTATGWPEPATSGYSNPLMSPQGGYPALSSPPAADVSPGYPAEATEQWRPSGQPPVPPPPGVGAESGYIVNGEPAVFRPWSEPTSDTLSQPRESGAAAGPSR